MPTAPWKRTSTAAQRPADVTPPDLAERLRQLQYHQHRQAADPEPPPRETPADRPESAPPVLPPEQPPPPDAPSPPEPPPADRPKRAPNELQSHFLTANLNKLVTIYLVNGVRLTGRLTGHDSFIVILAGPDGTETLTYKHAISTLVPGLSKSPPPKGQ